MRAALEDVLKRVAAGELTPEEALRLIDGEGPGGPSSASVTEPAGAASRSPFGTPQGRIPTPDDVLREPGSGRGVDDGPPVPGARTRPTGSVPTVRLLAAYRMVTVVGDPTVARVHVSGQHTVREEGDLLIVDGNWTAGPRRDEGEESGRRFAFTALPRSFAWAAGWAEGALTVRINPEVPLEIDATGSSLRVSGLESGARLRLLASSLKADRLRGPLDLDARTSSVRGSLSPSGASRIVTEQSSVKVALLPGTSLLLTATNRMGKVVLTGKLSKDGAGLGEIVRGQVGTGAGTLAVDSVMSSVVIAAEGFDSDPVAS